MKTINQINGAVDYFAINLYENLPYWKQRYFELINPDNKKRWDSPIIKNAWFMYIYKQFCNRINIKPAWSMPTIHHRISLDENKAIDFNFKIDPFYGVVVSIFSDRFRFVNDKIQLRSNLTWEQLKANPEPTCQNLIKKHFYAEGVFLQLQIIRTMTKEETKQYYKDWFANQRKRLSEPYPQWDADVYTSRYWQKKLKKLNIENESDLTITGLRKYYESRNGKRFKVKKVLQSFNPWQLHEQLMDNYDSDDEIMREAEEILSDPQVIWI